MTKPAAHDQPGAEPVRLDKWLWAARFFKTRALAIEAIKGGKVHVNGHRAKPAKDVLVGDALQITRGQEEFHVVVRGLAAQRGPAAVAAQLYEETPESVARRGAERDQRRWEATAVQAPAKRPNKQDRRKIIRFIRQSD